MKFCNTGLVLCAFFYPLILSPVRPRVAGAAVAAVTGLAGLNVGLSFQKRTRAIDDAFGNDLRQWREKERIFYTGSAEILGLGAICAVSYALHKRLPVVRIKRAYDVIGQTQKHSLMKRFETPSCFWRAVDEHGRSDLDPTWRAFNDLEAERALLVEARQEVEKAQADYQADADHREVAEAHLLKEDLDSAIAIAELNMGIIEN